MESYGIYNSEADGWFNLRGFATNHVDYGIKNHDDNTPLFVQWVDNIDKRLDFESPKDIIRLLVEERFLLYGTHRGIIKSEEIGKWVITRIDENGNVDWADTRSVNEEIVEGDYNVWDLQPEDR